jgi:membrane dipeptidase
MIDMHYDMLSVIYNCYLRNDFSYIESWIKNYNSDNVSGLIANLYFMNEEEMKEEFGEYYKEIDVVEMFKISTEIFNQYLPNTNVLFSIEGSDYIKDENELEELYKLGLRNILLVWNNPNKYGSGNKGSYGLTEEGKRFLKKVIDLGISIDVSHMNKNTFYDTINLVKEEISKGKEVKVIASHSNAYSLCNQERNLDDDQLKALKEVNAIVGVVSYSKFVKDVNSSYEELKDMYLKHINHIVDIMGINNVGISTDDMMFIRVLFNDNHGKPVFNYETIKNDLKELLKEKYNEEEIENILYKNVYNKLF